MVKGPISRRGRWEAGGGARRGAGRYHVPVISIPETGRRRDGEAGAGRGVSDRAVGPAGLIGGLSNCLRGVRHRYTIQFMLID